MLLSISQLALLRGLIHEHTGIFYPPRKNFFLEYRIQMLMRRSGYDNPAILLHDLSQGNKELWDSFIKSFTTNHTYFFREQEHFDLMVKDIWNRQISSPLIWVAASSTGEEVYSIAMTLHEKGIFGYRILASDINRNNLLALKAGEYSPSRMKLVPEKLRERYFTREKKGRFEELWQVKATLRQGLACKVLNLQDAMRFENRFHYIFCRNVLMYFDQASQNRVVEMLGENLGENGLLFIGHSENLSGPCRDLEHAGQAVFRKKVGNGKNQGTGS